MNRNLANKVAKSDLAGQPLELAPAEAIPAG
jgi:hypothetical protein